VPADGLVLLGVLDGDPDVVVSFDELGVAVGGGVDGGEADGVRSLGRSPTRLEPLSVQAVARVAMSASAERPKSALFMDAPPWGFDPGGGSATWLPPTDGPEQHGPDSPAAIA
jgi:hypothetical protein